MNPDWSRVRLGELGAPGKASFAMGPFGSRITTDNFVEEGVPVIRGVNLAGNRFLDEQFVYLTDEKADELASANAEPGDLVFTHRGTLGQVAMIPWEARYRRYVISQSQMKATLDPALAVPEFVLAFFRSPMGQSQLLASVSTTGVPAISRPLTTLKAIEIDLPPIGEQERIAFVVRALEARIDHSRATIAILDEIETLLFPKLVSGSISIGDAIQELDLHDLTEPAAVDTST